MPSNGSHIHYFDDSGRPLAARLEAPRERYRLRSGGKIATEAWIPVNEFGDLFGDVAEAEEAGLKIRPDDTLAPHYMAVGQPAQSEAVEAPPRPGKVIEEIEETPPNVTHYPITEDPAAVDPLDVDPLDADPESDKPPEEATVMDALETVQEAQGSKMGKDPLFADRMDPVNLKLAPEDVAYLKAEAETLDPSKPGVTLYGGTPTASSLLRLIIDAAFTHVMGGGELPEDPGPPASEDVARMSYTLPDAALNDARTLGGDGGYMPGIRRSIEAYRQGVIKV